MNKILLSFIFLIPSVSFANELVKYSASGVIQIPYKANQRGFSPDVATTLISKAMLDAEKLFKLCNQNKNCGDVDWAKELSEIKDFNTKIIFEPDFIKFGIKNITLIDDYGDRHPNFKSYIYFEKKDDEIVCGDASKDYASQDVCFSMERAKIMIEIQQSIFDNTFENKLFPYEIRKKNSNYFISVERKNKGLNKDRFFVQLNISENKKVNSFFFDRNHSLITCNSNQEFRANSIACSIFSKWKMENKRK